VECGERSGLGRREGGRAGGREGGRAGGLEGPVSLSALIRVIVASLNALIRVIAEGYLYILPSPKQAALNSTEPFR
jgi:hypothetical protein